MPDDIAATASADPERPAMEWSQGTVSYGDFEVAVQRATGSLGSAGVEPGDRVAMWAEPTANSVAALWAVPRTGATMVPLNTRWSAAQASNAVAAAGCRFVIVDGSAPDLGPAVLPVEALQHGPEVPGIDPGSSHQRFAVFTSGSSGPARGVLLTGANIAAAVNASQRRLGNGPEDRWLAVLPLFHVGGLSILWRSAQAAGTVVFEAFEPTNTAVRLLDDVTLVSLVPTMLRHLLEAGRRFAGLRAVLVGGGRMPQSLAAEAIAAGLPVIATYGMTEMASQVATQVPGDRSSGDPFPPLDTVEVRVIAEDGSLAGPGVAGTIEVRGPMLSPGYADGVTIEGWLRTSDRGRLDGAGDLTVEGRTDGVIISGGEKIAPEPIEAMLESHPSVSAAAVYGVPDPTWGEVVATAIVPASGPRPSEDELTDYLLGRVASFEVPRSWHFVDELPETGLGKLDRDALAHE